MAERAEAYWDRRQRRRRETAAVRRWVAAPSSEVGDLYIL